LKATTARISEASAEIQKTKDSLAESSDRLDSAKEQTQKALQEPDSELKKICIQGQAFEARVQKRERERDELQQCLDSMKSDTEEKLARYKAKIHELRRKLTSILETGQDDEVPRVDIEL
jgi:chromosome segregation ATPase